MVNRLEPLNLMDFTGGLNLRRNQFQLAENESPDMLNVDIDPRGGFYTRKGWQRWNPDDIVDATVTTWKPRNAAVHTWANGTQVTYVVNDNVIYWAAEDTVFSPLTGITADATPHLADFAPWGDDLYIACGMFHPSYRRNGLSAPMALDPDSWSEVDAPVHNTMPQAEFVAGHASYLFCAVTVEAGVNHFARVRWSHPGKPDSWREDDFLDIDTGGGRITGIGSFRDHLLIFKTNSMWALYGYDEDTWQLIKVSVSVGCPSVTAASRSESAVYFFSASDKGGIYAYSGESPVYISESLRPAFEEILAYENVFVSWAGRRLWVSMPWIKEVGSTASITSLFVLNPDIGQGAWTMYRSDYGAVGPVLDGSDVNARYPLSAFWSDHIAAMVTLDYIEDAYDLLLDPPSLGVTDAEGSPGYLTPIVGGIVTTPDPGPLPNECTFVFKVRGPEASEWNAIVSQVGSFAIYRRFNDHNYYWNYFPTGNFGQPGPPITGSDEHLAFSLTLNDGGGATLSRAWTSLDGQAWSLFDANAQASAGAVPADVSVPLRIGEDHTGAWQWDGRIYSIELRTGLDPAGGTVLWRFDANDYPGTGTSYVDPRGRTWTLTSAGVITPKVPPMAAGESAYLVTDLDQEIGVTGTLFYGQAFESYYRTRWLHAGWPDRKKSWRRPTFVCRQVTADVDLLVESFRDYNETTIHRTRILRVRAAGDNYWTEGGFEQAEIGGFDWTEGGKDDPSGRGADWGLERKGSNIIRAGSMGLARSVQMRVQASTTTPRRRWGVDGVVVKFVQRRFR